MNEKPFNVLFLCTGNSARSVLAESLLNQWGRGRFVGFSAGSYPKGVVHPIALELLKNMKVPTVGLPTRAGTSSQRPVRRKWISYLPFVTTLPVKCARFGRDNR